MKEGCWENSILALGAVQNVGMMVQLEFWVVGASALRFGVCLAMTKSKPNNNKQRENRFN